MLWLQLQETTLEGMPETTTQAVLINEKGEKKFYKIFAWWWLNWADISGQKVAFSHLSSFAKNDRQPTYQNLT